MDAYEWTRRVRELSDERDWGRFHTPKNLAMALSVEASELVEIFQWLTPEESAAVMDGPEAEHVREELADVLSYLLRLADVLDIDLDAAVADKLVKKAERYPAPGTSTRGAPSSQPPALEVTIPVLGVDGCRAGWVGALLAPGLPRPAVLVASTLAGLVETARERHPDLAVVAVDIPIGLPDEGVREAERLARATLPGKASSVFTTVTREAWFAADRAAADVVNRERSGQGVGAQTFGLAAKVREVDTYVRAHPSVVVVEVHPEVSFATMTGTPLAASKKTDEGVAARLSALRDAGIASPSVLTGSGYGTDDVLDAVAAAWTAHRVATGAAIRLPDPPEVFSDGISAAIHA